MPIISVQSDIAEVRDQISLDYADDKYLNIVSANLGLQRPPFGFSDAQWRALTRVIALQYKQIKTKFEAALEIILGPRVTQCGAFATNVLAGAKHAVLVDTDQFPQVGTMVIDAGLGVAETVNYIFIDRYTNTVYFETPLVNPHTAVAQTWETGVISDFAVGAPSVNVFDPSGFPAGTYTINIGRGTANEVAGPIGPVVFDARNVGIPASLGGTGASFVAGIQSKTPNASQINAHYLTLLATESLPSENGWLQSTKLTNLLTATAGSTTTVTVAGPVSLSRYGGFWLKFTGNVTGGLTNKIAYVVDNTATVFSFGNILPFAPAAGDTFTVLNNFQYIRVNVADESVLMKCELSDLQNYPKNSEFSLLRLTITVAIVQVQVKGVAWDVFQSDPHHVEILLPVEFLANNLRTASYIRQTGMSGATTADAIRNIGDTDVSLTITTGLPLIGVVDHATLNRYAYWNPHTWVTADAAIGAVAVSVLDTSQLFPTGTVDINGAAVAYTVLNATTLTVAPLAAAVRISNLVRDRKRIKLAKPLLEGVTAAQAMTFYTNYDSGDLWSVADVWPGPYVWDLFAETHKRETTPGNTLTTTVSGPTVLAIDRVLSATVFELADASSFPTAVPYSVLLGENSGNVETLAVQQLSLRSRTYETLAVQANPLDMTVQLNTLAGPTPPANAFPNGGPYRVVLSPFTVDQEVVEVTSTAGGNTLNLSQAVVGTHPIGRRAVLLADLIRVSPAAADDHMGKALYTDRFGLYAPETQTAGADSVRPLYLSKTLTLGSADFSSIGAAAVLNFGNAVVRATGKLAVAFAAAATTATLDSTATFPTTGYPYTVMVDVGAGPLLEEVLHVTNNNTGTNVLTFSHAAVFSHSIDRRIVFQPGPEENIRYTSTVGADLEFVPYILVDNTHYTMEFIAPSVGTGYPSRDGFDFPLRLPVTIQDRVQFMMDLIRAAGVNVTFVSKR